MVQLTTKNFKTLWQEWAAVAQASVVSVRPNLILNFSKGTILRALAEAQASSSLWQQGLILKLLTTTRLSTCQGIDVDTWLADFMPPAVGGVVLPSGAISPRLPPRGATGLVTFARNTPTNVAVIPVGALMQSSDGSQKFAVIADTTNVRYSPTAFGGQPGYTLPAQQLSLDVPVQFQFPPGVIAGVYSGPVGNVQIGAITVLQTGISGVDTITNGAPLTNGFLAESDAALKARFPLFIASLAKGTNGAIGYAVTSVQQGMQYQIADCQDLNGAPDNGMVTVFVDDGSGTTPPAIVSACLSAIFIPMRAAGIRLGVYPASSLPANVSMTIITAPGYYHPNVVAVVATAVANYINGIGLGTTPAAGALAFTRLSQVAYDASPGVTDVLNLTLNGGTADLVPGLGQVVKAGAIIVN